MRSRWGPICHALIPPQDVKLVSQNNKPRLLNGRCTRAGCMSWKWTRGVACQ